MLNRLNNRQFQEIIDFATRRSEANDLNHNAAHIELTAKIAQFLARYEGADAETCVVAAYLHDIGRRKSVGKHGVRGSKIARPFLKKIGLPSRFINDVCYAIAQHDTGSPKRTKEAQVLWDADKLQAIGPLGFLRIFAHHLLYDTKDIILARRLTEKRQDFFYKRFQTKTGRRLAKKLHDLMSDFYNLLDLLNNAETKKVSLKKLFI